MAEERQQYIDHTLVPKHTRCSEEEVEKVLSKFNVKKQQLPRISMNDPVIVHKAYEPGTIIKIERTSKTEPKSLFYRMVI